MSSVGGGAAVLLWVPSSFAVSYSSSALAAFDGLVGKCAPSCPGLRNLSLRKNKRVGRLDVAKASKEDGPEANREKSEKGSVDWDKAWSSFSKPSKKKSFLKLDMEQYVSRKPEHSNYPLSEDVDPLRKSERSALGAWTSLKFTYAVVAVIIGLAVYMVVIVGPPPIH